MAFPNKGQTVAAAREDDGSRLKSGFGGENHTMPDPRKGGVMPQMRRPMRPMGPDAKKKLHNDVMFNQISNSLGR